ncbi:Gfo/Idh/MocA family oxidoreductase [Pedobacter aquae]|uniref:Gfo/Idh/MocA family oxidoreductase n=1 Tax=Pedobacter aquae TaxID=2605747 RepID=A0A5C0VI86_9SPHI|nr:Gfo/Idh/MocA family oxidoreductase [Pedobacter aquae]QEK51532.1 Gfo/Idh/MocA family oxidoreductase [Pedobacter aquae]
MKDQEKEVSNVSRRKFLASAATLSAFMIVPRFVLGKGFVAPSDKINLGFIGTGKQSITLRRAFAGQEQAQIVAASDVYKRKLDFFAQETNKFYADKKGASQYKGCDVYEDYQQILERKDIDAVVIITPDHWHAVQAVAAAKAGKDIYCEKPLSLTIEEGRAMVNATRKYNRVFQTGSMQRSWDEFRQAVALIRGGYIGELDNIKVSVGPPPLAYNLPKEEVPADLNWEKWLGPNKNYSHFNDKLNPDINSFWAKWRDYKEFGGGMVSDWGAHMFDIVQWALNMDHSGPVAVTPPDENHKFLTFEYANGLKMTHENFGIGNAIQFNGKEGSIMVQRKKLEVNPASLQNTVIDAKSLGIYHSTNHYQDFLEAIKNRSKPICDVEIGHRTASVCNIANIAYELKRPLKWNPEKELFTNDQEANQLRGRDLKKGFKLS